MWKNFVGSRNTPNPGICSNTHIFNSPNGGLAPFAKKAPINPAREKNKIFFRKEDLRNNRLEKAIMGNSKNSLFIKYIFPNIFSGQLGCRSDNVCEKVANERNLSPETVGIELPKSLIGL